MTDIFRQHICRSRRFVVGMCGDAIHVAVPSWLYRGQILAFDAASLDYLSRFVPAHAFGA